MGSFWDGYNSGYASGGSDAAKSGAAARQWADSMEATRASIAQGSSSSQVDYGGAAGAAFVLAVMGVVAYLVWQLHLSVDAYYLAELGKWQRLGLTVALVAVLSVTCLLPAVSMFNIVTFWMLITYGDTGVVLLNGALLASLVAVVPLAPDVRNLHAPRRQIGVRGAKAHEMSIMQALGTVGLLALMYGIWRLTRLLSEDAPLLVHHSTLALLLACALLLGTLGSTSIPVLRLGFLPFAGWLTARHSLPSLVAALTGMVIGAIALALIYHPELLAAAHWQEAVASWREIVALGRDDVGALRARNLERSREPLPTYWPTFYLPAVLGVMGTGVPFWPIALRAGVAIIWLAVVAFCAYFSVSVYFYLTA